MRSEDSNLEVGRVMVKGNLLGGMGQSSFSLATSVVVSYLTLTAVLPSLVFPADLRDSCFYMSHLQAREAFIFKRKF